MKNATHSMLLAVVIAAAFLGGSWYGQHLILNRKHAADRRILYYTDPMHPAYHSNEPGIAPDCGMDLVPVYADEAIAQVSAAASSNPGTIAVSAEKQQLIGVRVSEVEQESGTSTIRLFGRVAPDEARVYKLNAGADGSIRQVSAVSTGSPVHKGQLLATFASPDFVTATQSYLVALTALDRLKQSGSGPEKASQLDPATGNPTNTNFQERLQKLENLGMSAIQFDEVRRVRKVPDIIKVFAPADGFVLARNVSEGQKFERGAEWYRIADLKRVWILADVSLNDASSLRVGMSAQVAIPGQNRALAARVSDVLPQVDAASGRLKVRLEADNPGYLLRPDMFVDVQVSVKFPAAVTVPSDAILDSGLRQTVFVERGEGVFEPREVKTGARFDDRVQIVAGLAPGERVVVSGNFLLNSESRLKTATAGMAAPAEAPQPSAPDSKRAQTEGAKDPACGMPVNQAKALAAGHTSIYRDQTYYFCSASCKRNFEANAAGYLKQVAAPAVEKPTNHTGAARASHAHGGQRG